MSLYRYALRIDKEFDKVRDFVVGRGFSGFAVREVADGNEHWHWYLESDNIKLNSFRPLLKRHVPGLAGNGSYSVKQCDSEVERYWRYCLKGEGENAGFEVAWRHGLDWTDEKFEQLHREFWSEAKKRDKKVLAGPIVEAVLETCKRTGIKYDQREKISYEYIKELVRRKKAINKFVVKSQCLLISALLCPDDTAVYNLASEIWI